MEATKPQGSALKNQNKIVKEVSKWPPLSLFEMTYKPKCYVDLFKRNKCGDQKKLGLTSCWRQVALNNEPPSLHLPKTWGFQDNPQVKKTKN